MRRLLQMKNMQEDLHKKCNKISIYDKTTGLPSNYVHTTHVDKNGNLLLGMWDIGLVVIEPNQIKFLFSKNKQLLYHDIAAIHENEKGIWLGGFSTGLYIIINF